jgi:hypothetical protein
MKIKQSTEAKKIFFSKLSKNPETFEDIYLEKKIRLQFKNRYYNPDFNDQINRINAIQEILLFISKLIGCQTSTFFKSISLLDSILSQCKLSENDIMITSFTCLSLVCKSEESKEVLNSLKQCQLLFKNPEEFNLIKYEKYILKKLKFDINVTTPFDFIQIFMKDSRVWIHQKFKFFVVDKNFFCLLIREIQLKMIENYDLNQYSALSVAIVCIMMARDLCGLKPLIPDFIKYRTGCTEMKISELFLFSKNLMKKFNNEIIPVLMNKSIVGV